MDTFPGEESLTAVPPAPLASPETTAGARRSTPAGPSTPLQSKRPASATDPFPSSESKRQRLDRITDFDKVYQDGDVYRNGKALNKYTIVKQQYTHPRYPEITGKFWIFRCTDCDTHYSTRQGAGSVKYSARTHLKYHQSDKSNDPNEESLKIFETLGVLVQDCSVEFMKKNNEAVAAAIREGYKPKHGTKRPKKKGAKGQEVIHISSSDDEISDTDENENNSVVRPPAPIVLITDPQIGELYTVISNTAGKERIFAGLKLPMGDFSEVGLSDSLETSGLAKNAHKWYLKHQNTGAYDWKSQYQGGQNTRNRYFPFLLFDKDTSMEDGTRVWVRASKLRCFNPLHIEQRYRPLVREYLDRQKHLSRIKEGECGT